MHFHTQPIRPVTITRPLAALAIALASSAPAARAQPGGSAQGFATPDPVVRSIFAEGMERSETYALAQTLLDSIGPRLTGSPGMKSGNDWLVSRYTAWGIPARNERYGTWRGWRRGVTHVDLVAPRVRTLEATMLAWSPGTRGAVDAPVVIIPDAKSRAEFTSWLPNVRGKYVLVSMPQRSCRPDSALRQWATPETFTSMVRQRTEDTQAWNARVAMTGTPAETTFALANRTLARKLEAAGARGVITSLWSLGWGVNKIFNARVDRVPVVDLSCEDYGLVYRLAANDQAPVLRVQAESQDLGEVPVFNTIAEIKGSEKPNEYVMLSAHFDSWDGASGATDNGTGTVVMLEAMRILRKVYPNPKRTILVGHWSGEEQGLNGSRAFAADHPEIVRGLQALFNQDNGTGRIVNVSPAGLVDASANLARWAARLPAEISGHINFSFPGAPAGGGSDNAAFICYGAPGFGLGSLNFDYGQYTWHTNRDTFDKIVFDDLKNNATLVATLVYLASEDPETVPRERRIFTPNSQTGLTATWPSCVEPQRSSTTYMR